MKKPNFICSISCHCNSASITCIYTKIKIHHPNSLANNMYIRGHTCLNLGDTRRIQFQNKQFGIQHITTLTMAMFGNWYKFWFLSQSHAKPSSASKPNMRLRTRIVTTKDRLDSQSISKPQSQPNMLIKHGLCIHGD